MMERWQRVGRLFGGLVVALTLSLTLAWGLAADDLAVTLRYVAASGADANNTCANRLTPCKTIQRAVDQARAGDEIRIAAGNYTGVTARAGVTQTVYISKSLTLRGGFTTANWTTPNPQAHPAIVSAQNRGRVFYITGDAGGRMVSAPAQQDVNVTLQGLRITGGNATNQGGSVVAGRDAGGGVYGFLATVRLDQCEVVANAARKIAGCCGEGGGLYLLMGALPVIENSLFVSNTAGTIGAGRGGGIYLEQALSPVVFANEFSENTASTRQAGWGGGLYLAVSDDAYLAGNTFWHNTASAIAEGRGGGLAVENSHEAEMVGNTFMANAGGGSAGRGGALYAEDSQHLHLEANLLIGNQAASTLNAEGWGGGGALYACRDYLLVNNVIEGNIAPSAGSGLWLGGGGPLHQRESGVLPLTSGAAVSGRLLHNTIYGNMPGDGAGVFVTDATGAGSQVEIINSIIATQTVGVYVTEGNHARLTATLWFNTLLDWGGPDGTVAHQRDFYGDPLLDPASGSAAGLLTFGSPAIDKGVDAGVAYDRQGNPRPRGRGFDLGADEYDLRVLYLPVLVRR